MLSQLVAKALLKGGWGDSPSGAKGRSPSLLFPSRGCLYECTDLTRLSSALPISAFKAGKVQTKERRDDGAGFSLPRRGLILHCF